MESKKEKKTTGGESDKNTWILVGIVFIVVVGGILWFSSKEPTIEPPPDGTDGVTPRPTPTPPVAKALPEDLEKIKQSMIGGEVADCLTIDNTVNRNTCLMNTAERKGSSSICNQIEGDFIKETCVQRVSRRTGDKSLCNSLTIETIKNRCLG